MKYIVDRIEGSFAVCEDENGILQDISLGSLPKGVKEGVLLLYENGEYDLGELSKEQKDRLQMKMDRLWK